MIHRPLSTRYYGGFTNTMKMTRFAFLMGTAEMEKTSTNLIHITATFIKATRKLRISAIKTNPGGGKIFRTCPDQP
jgi:hypothetical protein